MTIRVGVVGLGTMGRTHLDVYAGMEGVKIVAVADPDARRVAAIVEGEAGQGNIEGQAEGGSAVSRAVAQATHHSDALDLIADDAVDLVDLCLPTPWHLEPALAAIAAGKHVSIEKPLARTAAEAKRIAEAADAAVERDPRQVIFVAHCMRYWPGWAWLKEAIADQRFGRVLSATFTRLASHPPGRFYADGDLCGGAALDLHLHDADFVQHLFGLPQSVSSRGYSSHTNAIDHIVTDYRYDPADENAPRLVNAEGAWTMQPGFPFTMRYLVNFENATADFDLARGEAPLKLIRDESSETVAIPAGMGYVAELRDLISCIQSGRQPQTITVREAAQAVALIEAEVASARQGTSVKLRNGDGPSTGVD